MIPIGGKHLIGSQLTRIRKKFKNKIAKPSEGTGLALFPFGLSAACLIGWQWPLLGGYVSPACMTLSLVVLGRVFDWSDYAIWSLLSVPGVLYVIAGIEANRRTRLCRCSVGVPADRSDLPARQRPRQFPPVTAACNDDLRCVTIPEAGLVASALERLIASNLDVNLGRLDRDDFDADLEVDMRTWGSSVVALVRRSSTRRT